MTTSATQHPGLALGPIRQIAVRVADVPRAVAFYRDALGLPQLPIPAPPTLAFFDCHGVRLMLSTAEGPESDHPGSALYFQVADIHGAYQALRGRGVRVAGDPHLIARLPDHELWMAFFHDPDDNPLALMAEVRG